MLVGPGESYRWLDRTLRRASRWADVIVAYGDGADADTREALMSCKRVRCAFGPPLFAEDESAARNALLALCDDVLAERDLVVVIDADEELTATGGDARVKAALRELGRQSYDAWPVTFLHLWTPDGSLARVDRGWAPAPAPRIYRHRHGARIPQRELACAAIPPQPVLAPESSLGIRHWGYARPEDRTAKFERYRALDGGRFHNPWHIASIVEEPTLVPCES